MKHIKITTDYVLNEILTAYNKKYNLSDSWQILGKPLIRREAFVFKVKSNHFSKNIALKIYTNHQEIVEKQFKAFGHYFDKMNDKFNVPKPYGYLTEYGVIITDWIDYIGADKTLFKFNMDFNGRSEFVKGAGIWLKEFHKCSEVEIKKYSSSYTINKIDSIIDQIEGFNSLYIKLPQFKKAYNKMLEYSNKFNGMELEYINIHGDFTPSNLLAEDKYLGIDFNQNINAPAISDIARFLMYLDVYRKFLTKKSSLIKYGCNKSDFDAFMSGYGEYDNRITKEFFYYIQLCEVLRRFTSLCVGRKPKGLNKIYRLVELYRIGRMIKYLLIALDKFNK